jgi:putative ABC transport system permease protein
MKNEKTIPPKFANKLLHSFLRSELAEEVRGDLEEKFYTDLKNKSDFKVKLNYWYEVLNYLRPFAIRKSRSHYLNNYDMYQSYFKIGWRNLLHHKGFSFINISGLAVGMTACVLIMLYVVDEMSYDTYHVDGDRIYRVASQIKDLRFVAAAAPIADGLKRDFPEVEQSTRVLRFPGADQMLLKEEKSKKQFFEINGYYVDSTFFQLFTYSFKYGNASTALDQPNSIILSESLAKRFFGTEDPLDKALRVSLPFGDFNYNVKGVFTEGNKSHIPANFFLTMNNSDIGGWVKNQTNWATNNIFYTYVKLKAGTSAPDFESKLPAFLDRNGGSDLKAAGFSKNLFIQPMPSIYLRSHYDYEVAANGDVKYLYIFASIGGFLLLIACINFMNLSTAKSERRAKEVGMRKVVGAMKHALVSQFLIESLLTCAIAFFFSLLLIQLFIPLFNQLVNKQLYLGQLPYVYFWLWLLTIVTGLVAGIYPAFYLSSFKPVTVLKGKLINTFSAATIRRGLVVFQFTISIVLILGALVISNQMDFLKTKDLGFNKSQKIVLPLQTNESVQKAESLKNELLMQSQLVSATQATAYPGIENISDMLFYPEGKSVNESVDVMLTHTGGDYLQTLGIELLSGRDFLKPTRNDSLSLILNESAVKNLGYTSETSVGKNIYYEWMEKKYTMKIIGVMKDYHFQSLHQEIKPMALTVSPTFAGSTCYLVLHANTANYTELIKSIEKAWLKINADSPFVYSFLDGDFQKNYKREERTMALIRYFTVIAIIIASLGLFGLANFTAEQRLKEIGIRKALGASLDQVVMLLSRDFLKLVVLAILLAAPIGYYAMERWLQSFAYHIDISLSVFVIAAIVSIAIAMLTISFQSVKAAMTNPVNSLKAE